MHPLQYELETARHTDYQHRAAQLRQVSQAERAATGRMLPAARLCTIGGRVWWHISHLSTAQVLTHAQD
jgi:hypothetical protein